MKRREETSRFDWPRDGVAIRIPPRRLAADDASCECIAFSGNDARPAQRIAWGALSRELPRGTRVVILVAAEDVSFTQADVPALSGLRLREALPNLVEDRTVGELGSLHVAMGGTRDGDSAQRALAMVDRTWLAAMQVHVVRAGHRVAAIVAESLAVPWHEHQWSLAVAGDTTAARHAWLRTDAQQAIGLPDDASSASTFVGALSRGAAKPSRIRLYGARDAKAAHAGLADAIASATGVTVEDAGGDPFVEWLKADGPDGAFGAPLSLLAFESASGGLWSDARRWRIAAVLAIALLGVQLFGMHWEWGGLRREAGTLRTESAAMLTTAFPDTRVVLDAPLQMTRSLAALRASAGRSDPADFSSMMAASGRIFASVPSNGVKGAEYEARNLRLRLAAGIAGSPEERDRLVALAAQEGYLLRFDSGPANSGESIASLRIKGAA